jgi:hypothetical protein
VDKKSVEASSSTVLPSLNPLTATATSPPLHPNHAVLTAYDAYMASIKEWRSKIFRWKRINESQQKELDEELEKLQDIDLKVSKFFFRYASLPQK